MSIQNDTVLCNECGQRINATTTWCTPCNAKHFECNFQNWTSGSVELDEFIRKTQITAERHECIFEWVDYSKFSLLKKVEHSKNHRAYWEEGPLLGWNTKSNEWTRNGGQWVKLITNFCGEKYYASRFLKSEYEASKSNPSKRLVYGMTRNPVTNYYAVIERLIDRCPDCHKEWMSLRWCRGCNPKHFEFERHKWASGNSGIDDFILETQITAEFSDQALEWIPETQLTELKLIGKGGFGTVFKAKWKEGRIYKWDSAANKWKRGESMWVALKSVEKGVEEDVKEFLEEIKAMHQCRKVNLGSLDCYGVTRHPETKKYLMVMRFVEFGDLRNYLSNFATNSWKDLLDRLWSLTIDLRSLHRLGLVHRDLHSGNVLFGDNRRNFVADLGLACEDGQNITGEIKGVLPYVAPEILRRQPHTKASDIYSFGIIMWELTSPQPPFYETAYNFDLALSICDGKRPQVIKGTPACYVELMKKCWDPDPSKRPTAQEMAEIFKEWTQILSKDELLNEEEKSIKDQFVSSDLERQRSSRPTITFQELSTRFTSRCLPTVSLSNQDELQYQTTQYGFKITNDLPF